jgi:hypothetical protein
MCVYPRYMLLNGESDGVWFELGSSFEVKFVVNLFFADEPSCGEDAEGHVDVPQRFDDMDEGAQGVWSCTKLAWTALFSLLMDFSTRDVRRLLGVYMEARLPTVYNVLRCLLVNHKALACERPYHGRMRYTIFDLSSNANLASTPLKQHDKSQSRSTSSRCLNNVNID